MLKIGFIDYYLDEWHANSYPKMIRDAAGEELVVAYAYGQIPSPITGMTSEAWCEKYGVEQCLTVEELVEKSDVLLVLSPDNCEMHEELCQLPLRSGKRTYIDKTFAPDLPTGQRIFALAEQYGTPCYSTSALRYAEEYVNWESDPITAISSWGPNGFDRYSIHQLEPTMMLMKTPVKRVMYTAAEKWYTVNLEFADGRPATLTGFDGGCPFMMQVATTGEAKSVTVKSDFFGAFIRQLCDFFLNGTPKVSHEETLSIMAVRGAVLEAMDKPGQWVAL